MLPVGPFVEPPAEAHASASAPATPDDGSGYDYAINSLLFKLAIKDEYPYQRATAQFRKEQFDSSNQVGDQSLSGWWTRGQFSFHKGAGVTYYEVSEGETVLNRYSIGDGVFPWKAGQVSCQRGWEEYADFPAGEWVEVLNGALAVLRENSVYYNVTLADDGDQLDVGSDDVRALTVGAGLHGYAAVIGGAGYIVKFDTLGNVTTIYDGLTADLRGIWYVKSRLIVQDGDGKWYQLAADPTSPPVTVSSGDEIFTAQGWSGNRGVVADTPGPLLIADGNRVFALTADATTGALPSLATPVQVAELPSGESIAAMTSHLGFIALVTTAGVRLGVLSDSGQLTYGPLLVEHDPNEAVMTCNQVAKYGTRLCAQVDTHLVEIDLAQQIGSGLEFAWTRRGTPDPFTTPGGYGGVVNFEGGLVVYSWDGGWYSSPTSDFMAGSLTTGFHRFGTLEQKSYQTVRVTGLGAYGTITISKVLGDGTTISLYTLDVALSHDVELSLGPVTADVLGLKFDLAPAVGHEDVSPILLGYQIRALPVPERQRMIRIPVMLYDQERRQPAPAVGHVGWAWERLRALENLEQSNAVVSFRDYRTGEAGTAFIESIEFENRTPPSAQSTGFGGIGWITLRKVS